MIVIILLAPLVILILNKYYRVCVLRISCMEGWQEASVLGKHKFNAIKSSRASQYPTLKYTRLFPPPRFNPPFYHVQIITSYDYLITLSEIHYRVTLHTSLRTALTDSSAMPANILPNYITSYSNGSAVLFIVPRSVSSACTVRHPTDTPFLQPKCIDRTVRRC